MNTHTHTHTHRAHDLNLILLKALIIIWYDYVELRWRYAQYFIGKKMQKTALVGSYVFNMSNIYKKEQKHCQWTSLHVTFEWF